jgi:hypothetical protein
MEPLTTSLTLIEIVGGALSIAAVVGGILMKAFIKPLQDELIALQDDTTDHEGRLRYVENKTTEHDVHISQLISTSERLLTKMDQYMTVLMSRDQ